MLRNPFAALRMLRNPFAALRMLRNWSGRTSHKWQLLALAVLFMLLSAAPASAHGGGRPRLVGEQVGPYLVFAWTSPDPVREGTMHVTVALAEPGSEAPVFDADVLITVTPLNVDAEPLTARATHLDAANKLTYETDLEVPQAGQWQVSIDYSTPAGQGSTGFDLEVKPKSFVNWLLIGAGGLVLVVAGWLFWPGKSQEATSHKLQATSLEPEA